MRVSDSREEYTEQREKIRKVDNREKSVILDYFFLEELKWKL